MNYPVIFRIALAAAIAIPAVAQEAPPPAKPAPAADEPKAGKAAPKPAEVLAKHKEGSSDVAGKQDELSADVQQLTIEQTQPKVIELLESVETIMDDAIDWLLEYDTGGRTIAAQTEVIEKIFEAAKQRQQKGSGSSSGAMMDMMQKMMEQDEGKEPGDKDGKGKKPGDKGGQGQTGEGDPGDAGEGDGAAKHETRRVPRAGGNSAATLPEEFRRALDAYNRGLEKQDK